MGSVLRSDVLFDIKRIAIIGAGPCGLAVAKYLLAENVFEKIDIIEQQAEVGGVWNYTPIVGERLEVPSTRPPSYPDKPLRPKDGSVPIFSNPMYERLHTNIPKNLMQYSDQDFSLDMLLYPTREDVQDYLIQYSKEIRHLISFSSQVEDVAISGDDSQERWIITTKSTITNEEFKKKYDAVVVSSGHYSVPFIPFVPGMVEFNKAHPSVISHAKIYRSPEHFKDKKVIVVGNGPSGLDIGTQISEVCRTPLLNSVRTASPLKLGEKEDVPPIVGYQVEDRAVRFADGRVEKDVDAIVYCTGYLWSYPFLNSLNPPVVTTGHRVLGVWQQLFNTSHPTMAFTALSWKIVPFPLSECQGAAIAKVWSNRISLPSKEEMKDWEKKQVEDLGEGNKFHELPPPKDGDYINFLHDWVMSAERRTGKEPPYWEEKQRWVRRIFQDIRKKFIETGGTAKSMEELGFDFERRDK